MNNISFTGIKISKQGAFFMREVVRHLKNNGYECCGSKIYDVKNFSDKQLVFEYIRSKNDFSN